MNTQTIVDMNAAKMQALRDEINNYHNLIEQTERLALAATTPYRQSFVYARLEEYAKHLDSLTYELNALTDNR